MNTPSNSALMQDWINRRISSAGQAPKVVTATVKAWQTFDESVLPLPHPSPRNNIWLKKNPWFEKDVLPALRRRTNYIVPVITV